MEYRDYLQTELMQCLEDIKRIKFMHCDAESIRQKRISMELRVNTIRDELERLSREAEGNGRLRVGRSE